MATERTVLVRLKANASDFNRAMVSARASLHGLRDEIDTTNDRTAWLAQSILGLGPALVPIGAVAVPAMAALVAQMTVAGVAAGTLALAFNGVGDGVKALNDYQLAPTGENLDKMRVAMDKLGPDGAHFVRFLDDAGSQLRDLQLVSRAGVFPGMEEGITAMLTRLPEVKSIVGQVASGLGELSAQAGEGLAGGKFDEFFSYIESDAKPILMDMGHTVGFLAEGFANLLVGFGPMTMSFSDGMEGMARSFAVWSRSLDSNASFQSFLDYIRESGPRVIEFLGSLVHAFASVLEAAAPVGAALLPIFSSLLDAISNLADTPLGPIFLTAAAAMSIYGRAAALASITTGGLLGTVTKSAVANARTAASFTGLGAAMSNYARNALTAGAASERMNAQNVAAGGRFREQGKAMGVAAGQAALLAASMTGVADNMHVTNTVTGALIGSMFPGLGTAIGATAGAMLDLRAAGDGVMDILDRINHASTDGSGGEGGLAKLKADAAAATAVLKDWKNTSGIGDMFGDFFAQSGASLHGLGGLLGSPTSGLSKEVDNAKAKVAEAQAAINAIDAQRAAANLAQLGGAARATGDGMRYAGMSAADFEAHIQRLNNVLEDRASMRDYQASLDDFRKGLKRGDHAWDIHYAKGRQNQALLDNIAATAIRMTKNMSQADKIKTLSRARGDFIRAAEAAGIAHAQAVRLANRLLGMNAIKSQPKVELRGAQAAISAANAITHAVNSIPGFHLITIEERRKYTGNNGPGSAGQVRTPAGGGQVRAMFPGETTGPKDDTIPARLSHREFVHQVAAVDYYGERFMSDVNNRRFPKPMGYAEGGSVGGGRVAVAAPNVNLGDAYIKVTIDGREIDARVEMLMDQRDDVQGSYERAVRTAPA